MRHMLAFLFVLGILFMALPARADQNASEANINLALQLADMYTTRTLLRDPRFYERNPLAKPFVGTDANALAYAIGINVLNRMLYKNHPGRWHTQDAIEITMIVNNLIVGHRSGVTFGLSFKR